MAHLAPATGELAEDEGYLGEPLGSVAFIAGNALHTADHFRQGLDGLSWELLASPAQQASVYLGPHSLGFCQARRRAAALAPRRLVPLPDGDRRQHEAARWIHPPPIPKARWRPGRPAPRAAVRYVLLDQHDGV
ncbi:MAG TPA: hypothetical protein VKF14_01880 [Candidatus Dormibacteraeota bacterium]|nr:hypothetical protein [Candidatus Dormibacteraeota bacterium]